MALGGNVGGHERIIARFRAAVRLLVVGGGFDTRASHVYESPPAGPVRSQPRFLNAVVSFQLPHRATPIELLRRLWRIERSLGRRRPARPAKGPRPIDLDLITFRSLRCETRALILPHPRAAERVFVTRPLDELRGAPLVSDDRCRVVAPPTAILSIG